MKIGLLTYDHPHRKTQDLFFQLLMKDHEITLVIFPWQNRKQLKPLFPHRPEPLDIKPYNLRHHTELTFIENYKELDDINVDYFIIGGAGIIPHIPKVPIINAHPGLLPYVRGLDALKWSIYYGLPTGVTVHQIDNDIDSGKIIHREEITPHPGEQFYHFAMRIYEAEVANLIRFFDKPARKEPLGLYDDALPGVQGRMIHHLELRMIKKYEVYEI